MKKMIIGLVAGLMIGTAGTALAATTQQVQALFAKFNLSIDGQGLVEIEPLVYDGTSYLPVREVANLLGYDVDYEHSNRLITLDTPVDEPQAGSIKEPAKGGTKVNATEINMDEWISYDDLYDFYSRNGKGNTSLQGTDDGKTKLTLAGSDIIFPLKLWESLNVTEPTIHLDETGNHSLLIVNGKWYHPADIGESLGLPTYSDWISMSDLEKEYPQVTFEQSWYADIMNEEYFTPKEVTSSIGKIQAMKGNGGFNYFYIPDIERLLRDQ
ncbi:stalk domain-containing protein [Paenibacillus senegalensis]|uniref:stalk domain-containing protein n=1 Tax=Paenibacillus senegalensis TaxID=1465766 RepID=UPI0002889ECA|nr:hypothetical protein [Paenibacillus senegalensis]